MADNDRDTPEFKSLSARIVRGIDGGQGALKSVWAQMTFGRGGATGAGIALILGAASAGGGFLMYQFQDPPRGGITSAGIDADISGRGFMNRTYSFVPHAETYFMLIRDEGRTELYQWSGERRRVELVEDFDLARQIVSEIATKYKEQIAGFNLDQGKRYQSDFYSCPTIENPIHLLSGINTRFYSGCEVLDNKTVSEITAAYRQTQGFWEATLAQMAAETYGPGQNITQYVAPDTTGRTSYVEASGNVAEALFALWAGLGIAGAGVSGLRRRAETPKRRR